MLVDPKYRARLADYCLVKRIRQEVAVNEMIGEALERIEQDPVLKVRLDKARELKAALDAL